MYIYILDYFLIFVVKENEITITEKCIYMNTNIL